MSRKTILMTAVALISLTFMVAGNAEYASAEEDNTICQGVYIDEVDVSGMTKKEAEAAVDDFVQGLRSKGVAVIANDNIVYTSMGDLGYTYEKNDNIDRAMALGKSGNLIKQYKDLKDIEQGNIVYPLTFTYDEEKIRNIVAGDVSAYNIAPINASVTRKNGEFTYTDHTLGKKVNIDETIKIIEDAITNWARQDIVINAAIEDDEPLYTREDVERCNTVIGSYTTEYASSAEGRAANLANGARLINNIVLYPGDIFNSYDVLTPFTAANGYFIAGAYLNGVVVDSVGGGACQVTTTLYNAVLEAELEVVERFPHSMTISYVDLSRDAAIAGTYKNFQFKNNTDSPILIEATTRDRRITFKLWGNETRDTANRKIKYETVVISSTKPPKDVVTEDPKQPTTYRKVTQTAHTGYRAQLWKVVYENGVEVSRTQVNSSNYQAAPQYVTIGTKEITEDKEDNKGSKKDDKKGSDKPNNDSDQNNSDNNSTDSQDQTEDIPVGEDEPIIIEDPLAGWDPSWEFEEPVD